MEKKKTSPWVYVGLGCLGLVLVAALCAAAVGYYAYTKAKEFQAEMKDPAARQAKALKVLGAERLPDGYYATMSLSIPYVMDMAILGDHEAGPGEHDAMAERGFVYLSVLSQGKDEQQLRDYFEGKTDDAEVLRRNNIRLRSHGTIRRGSLPLSDFVALYLAQHGEMNLGHRRRDGITTTLLFQCQGDARMRMGFWFGPEPSKADDYTGTPADEDALRAFLGHFHPCVAGA